MLINQTNKFVKDLGISFGPQGPMGFERQAHWLKLYDNLMTNNSQRPKSPRKPSKAGHEIKGSELALITSLPLKWIKV